MEAVAPIYSGARLSGVLRCGYSLKGLTEESEAVKRDWGAKMTQLTVYFASLTGLFLAIGVIVAAVFTRSLVRSTRVLNDGVKRVFEGDLEHQIRQEGLVCSELENLTGAFNAMTAQIRISYQQLDEYSRSLELKVAERTRSLEEAQAALVEQAHEAGMAEMAVEILHNIGNAITPAKVEAALLLKRLKESPVRRHLEEIMARARGVVEGTVTLSAEEMERLLKIMRLLPEGIKEEYDRAVENLGRIRAKHEHIESIIHLQMRYARLSGDTEEVDVNRLVEDAVEMLDESLKRRSVQVVKDLAPIPPVRIEQAKLIQILVNLIKNAYEAMQDFSTSSSNALAEDRLTITTRHDAGPPEEISISVRDTGVGFSPEEREKLFRFGYTTKSRGSGFGLHSCANYLIANRGSISARSEGKGRGAELVIRLPVDHGAGGA